MTDRDALTLPSAGADHDETIVKFDDGFETRIATIKRDLAQWLDQRPAYRRQTTIALLETAFDRYLADRSEKPSDLAPAAADALDMAQPILRRAVQRRRASLYKKNSGMPDIPANDEEWANRLTEMLKLFEAVAGPLPNNSPLRQFIDDAAEPLQTLLGYFAGGLGSTPGSQKSARRKAGHGGEISA